MATNDETLRPGALNLALRVRDYEIQEMDVSSITLQGLEKAGIRTYGDLITKTEEELLALTGIGPWIMAELKEALGMEGLTLGIQLPD